MRPARLAIAAAPEAPFDERLLRLLTARGRVLPRLFPETELEHIAAWGADALLVTGARHTRLLKTARRFHGHIPVLLGHDPEPPEASPLPRLRQLYRQRRACRYADAAFFAGGTGRAACLRGGLRPEQLFFMPYPLCPERASEPGCDARVREERIAAGIAETDRVLLFTGEFEERNAPGILLEQFLFFLRTPASSGWRLAMAGEGPLGAMLREMAATEPRIHFLPFRDPAEACRLGDLVALPSKRAGTRSGAILEAMASSRPVLVTENAGDALDLIRPGVTGWSVDSAHPELWFEYMRMVSREQLRAMGEAARTAASTWSAEAAASAVEQALRARFPAFFPEKSG